MIRARSASRAPSLAQGNPVWLGPVVAWVPWSRTTSQTLQLWLGGRSVAHVGSKRNVLASRCEATADRWRARSCSSGSAPAGAVRAARPDLSPRELGFHAAGAAPKAMRPARRRVETLNRTGHALGKSLEVPQLVSRCSARSRAPLPGPPGSRRCVRRSEPRASSATTAAQCGPSRQMPGRALVELRRAGAGRPRRRPGASGRARALTVPLEV